MVTDKIVIDNIYKIISYAKLTVNKNILTLNYDDMNTAKFSLNSRTIEKMIMRCKVRIYSTCCSVLEIDFKDKEIREFLDFLVIHFIYDNLASREQFNLSNGINPLRRKYKDLLSLKEYRCKFEDSEIVIFKENMEEVIKTLYILDLKDYRIEEVKEFYEIHI